MLDIEHFNRVYRIQLMYDCVAATIVLRAIDRKNIDEVLGSRLSPELVQVVKEFVGSITPDTVYVGIDPPDVETVELVRAWFASQSRRLGPAEE